VPGRSTAVRFPPFLYASLPGTGPLVLTQLCTIFLHIVESGESGVPLAKLHEVLAVMNNGKKARTAAAVAALFHGKAQKEKASLFQGAMSTYKPLAENEHPIININMPLVNLVDVTLQAKEHWIDLLDTMATIEVSNVGAAAPLVIDGEPVTAALPVYFLMPFRKNLLDIRTFVTELDTLDPAYVWTWDAQKELYFSQTTKKERTKKTPVPFERVKATDKHPAQVDLLYDDKIVGYTEEVKFSSSIPAVRKREMLADVNKLIDSVDQALAVANQADVKNTKVAASLLDPIFEKMKQSA
jgi:hypothetical protein